MVKAITKEETRLRTKRKFMFIIGTEIRITSAPKDFKTSVIRFGVKKFVKTGEGSTLMV